MRTARGVYDEGGGCRGYGVEMWGRGIIKGGLDPALESRSVTRGRGNLHSFA